MPKKSLQIIAALVVVNLIWGAAGPLVKYTIAFIPPVTLLFFRYLLVCIILLPYILVELKKVHIPTADYLNLFLLGVMSQTANVIAFISLEHTTALDATVIGISASVLAIFAGHYFYKERVDRKLKMGVFIASLGTVIIVIEPIICNCVQGGAVSIAERVYGNILALVYNLTWVIYVVWSKYSMGERSTMVKKTLSFIHIKPMTKKYSPTLIVTLSFYVGLITVLPLMLYEQFSAGRNYSGFNLFNVDTKGILGLLYIVVFSSIIAYLLNQWALEHATISQITIISYLGTLFAFPTAYLVLGEIPSTYTIAGSLVITVGVVIAEMRNS
jgi:drug/metabolite transporter (DMT)-like permease